ncbi:MAG: MGMT family protein [Mycobacteriaceae bacterium]
MPKVSDQQVELVRELIAAIPPGKVSTYGDIAAAAGLKSARTVGWILRIDSLDLPWHRVLPSSGKPATHIATKQLDLLAQEGISLNQGRVRIDSIRHHF